jgi:hypothetical protein
LPWTDTAANPVREGFASSAVQVHAVAGRAPLGQRLSRVPAIGVAIVAAPWETVAEIGEVPAQ